MNAFVDLLKEAKVKATSPDRSVTVTASLSQGITVTVADQHLNRHNDQTLARQAETAITGALNGWLQARLRISQKIYGDNHIINDRARRHRENIANTAEKTSSEGTSTDTRVKATLNGPTQVAITIKPRTVNYIDPRQLETSINEAFTTANKQFTRNVMAERDKLFNERIHHLERSAP